MTIGRFKYTFTPIDERAGARTDSLPLLSVSQYRGVIPRADLAGDDGRAADLTNYKTCRSGDIVLNRMSAYNGAVGLAGQPGLVSPDYLVLRPQPHMSGRYMAYLIRSHWFIGEMTSRVRGIGSIDSGAVRTPRIGLSELGEILVDLPGVEGQQAIADYLDRETAQIDAFIAKSEELIALLSERRMALVMELVSRGLDRSRATKDSGVPWLGVIPEHWDTVRARYLCSVATGDGDTVDAVDEGEFPFYVRSDTPQRSDRYGYDLEAVLTSGDGAGVGKVFHLVKGRFAAHQRVYVMHHFKRVSAAFFYRFFAAYFGVVALDGSAKSTVDSVRRHMITNMPIAVPPAEEQEAIVAVIEKRTAAIDDALATAQTSISLAKERRAALISTAVTGKLDVEATVA